MLGERLNRFGTAGVSLLLAAFLVGSALPAAAEGMGDQKFKPGDKAPDFVTKDLAGKEQKLSTYTGKNVVLLNFWGIRCGACLEEMPYLEEIAKKYAGNGLVTLGVDTDGVDAKTIVETLQEVQVAVTYPLLLDEEFKITDTYTNFLVPLTIVIDKGGVIQYIHTGFEKGTEKHYDEAARKALGL
ncbi:MAG TPA: TlpA disulfide reductase family protein [bacterium]